MPETDNVAIPPEPQPAATPPETEATIEPPRGRLVLGVIARWASMGVSIILGLIVTPVIIRTLGKEAYGLWGLAATFVGFYGLFDFGLSSAISRFIGLALGARDVAQLNRVASTGRFLLTILSVLVVIFALAIIGPAQSILRIPPEFTHEFRWLVLLSAASVVVSMMTAVYGGALMAAEDFTAVSLIGTASAFVRSLAGLAAVLGGGGVIGMAACNLGATILGQSAIYWRSRKRLPVMRSAFYGSDRKTARALGAFAAATFVAMVAALVRSRLDMALVTRFCGMEKAGLYAVTLTLFAFYWRGTLAATGVLWPRMNMLAGGNDSQGLRRFFLRTSTYTSLLVGGASGMFIATAPWILRLWLGAGYEESATALRILVAGYCLDIATNPAIGCFYAKARHRYFAGQTVAEALASFGLAVLLGRTWGRVGVALGLVIPITFVKLTVQPVVISRIVGISFRVYWLRCVGLSALLALAGGLLAFPANALIRVIGLVPTAYGASAVLLALCLSAAGVVRNHRRRRVPHAPMPLEEASAIQ